MTEVEPTKPSKVHKAVKLFDVRKQPYKALFLIGLLSLFLPSPSFASPASSHVITFSTTTYADPYEVQLDFKVEIDVTLPSELPSGESKDVTIYVWRDWATATLELEPFLPQERMFLTPLGDSTRIYVGTLLGELKYYIQLTNVSVLMEINIEGNGTVSPTSLLWSSASSKSFTVSHVGSASSEEMLTLQMALKYVGSLTLLTIGQYGIIIDKTVRKIELTGDQTLSENIEVVPPKTVSILAPLALLLVLLLVIALIVYIHYRRTREKKVNAKEEAKT